MPDIAHHRRALLDRTLCGAGHASHEQRRAAFDNAAPHEPLRTLINKVALCAYTVTDEDVAAVKAAGISEDDIFELVVCAALGQATRQHDSALAALDAAGEEG